MVKNELYYNREANMKYKKMVFSSIGFYACDLLIYQLPCNSGKRNAIYILVIIDQYSRYVGAGIQKDKEAETTLKNYKEIIKDYFDNENCDELYCDGGSEFLGKFKEYIIEKGGKIKICIGDGLRDKNVKLENSICERVNRTIRDMIKERIPDYAASNKKDISIGMLDDIVHTINYRKHRTIEKRPIDVWRGKAIPNQSLRKHNIGGDGGRNKQTFEIGDKVRVSKQFDKMSKDSKRNELNSKDVYRIVEREGNQYKLNSECNGKRWFKYSRLMISKDKVSEKIKVNTKAEKQEPPEKQEIVYEKRTIRKQPIKCNKSGCDEYANGKSIYCENHKSWGKNTVSFKNKND